MKFKFSILHLWCFLAPILSRRLRFSGPNDPMKYDSYDDDLSGLAVKLASYSYIKDYDQLYSFAKNELDEMNEKFEIYDIESVYIPEKKVNL